MSDLIDDSPSIEEPPLPQAEFSWRRLVGPNELPQGRGLTVGNWCHAGCRTDACDDHV